MNKKNLLIRLLLVVFVLFLTIFLFDFLLKKKNNSHTEIFLDKAYKEAVEDAWIMEKEEIFPLVSITKNSSMVTWDNEGKKILLLSWHKYPKSFQKNTSFFCKYGEIWTFTDKEIISWYQKHGEVVDDWELRFKQLLGLPFDKPYTHFTAFWVDTNEVIRPAYQTDITKQISINDLNGSTLGKYKEWFNKNINESFFDSKYAWTRLGYTYDWAHKNNEYGLSEFIILPNATVEVVWTITTTEFVRMLKSKSLMK